MSNYLVGVIFLTIGLVIILINDKLIDWNRKYYGKFLSIKVKKRKFFYYFHKIVYYLGGLFAIVFGIKNLIN